MLSKQMITQYKSIINSNNKFTKINLLDMDISQIRQFFINIGEKPFRSEQIMKWIYHKYCTNFDLMTNINKTLRNKLKLIAEIRAPKIIHKKNSIDGTIKWLIKVDELQEIETVYIPEKNRTTICISSQIGCALGCKFCLTAKQGFNRNLQVSEIIGQVWNVSKIIYFLKLNKKKPITNVVIMGMGEPLLNIKNIITAIKIMMDNCGFGLSKRHITLSTVGIVPGINKLSNFIDIKLAISLHAPNDIIRNEIIPINKKYNIQMLLNSINKYLIKSKANHGGITIEYIMLYNINDNIQHAHELAKCLKKIPSKINLIPWNSFPGVDYISSSNERIKNFAKILIQYGFNTFIRKNRGHDIYAACGQLKGKVINKNI